jgi:hypothetical protein
MPCPLGTNQVLSGRSDRLRTALLGTYSGHAFGEASYYGPTYGFFGSLSAMPAVTQPSPAPACNCSR